MKQYSPEQKIRICVNCGNHHLFSILESRTQIFWERYIEDEFGEYVEYRYNDTSPKELDERTISCEECDSEHVQVMTAKEAFKRYESCKHEWVNFKPAMFEKCKEGGKK